MPQQGHPLPLQRRPQAGVVNEAFYAKADGRGSWVLMANSMLSLSVVCIPKGMQVYSRKRADRDSFAY